MLEEDLQDATTAQRRRFHSSPVLLEGGVTINMNKKDDLHWKEFFDGEAKKIHDVMTGMFDETEDSGDRPVVAANYAKLKKHLEEQEATDRAKKRKDAIRVCRHVLGMRGCDWSV